MKPGEQIREALRLPSGLAGFVLMILGVVGVIALYVFDPEMKLPTFLVFALGMVTVVGTRMFTTSLTEVRNQHSKDKDRRS